MLFARSLMARVPGIGFWKLFGSGVGEGFTPFPNTSVYAILATFPKPNEAERQIEDAPVFRRYRTHASEAWTLFLAPISSRGSWSGRNPFEPSGEGVAGPVAALTRATLKIGMLPRFWRRVPEISAVIGRDQDVIFKIGVGEVPWLHQVTFSIWPNEAAMTHFARGDGPHAQAIRAVREGGWFAEELYARFRLLGERGSWDGESPLTVRRRTDCDQ